MVYSNGNNIMLYKVNWVAIPMKSLSTKLVDIQCSLMMANHTMNLFAVSAVMQNRYNMLI